VEEMPAVEIAPAGDGKWDVLAWKPGVYTLETSQGSRAEARIESIAPPEEIAGPWELRFPEDWGAPPHKTLPKLISWTDDADEGVRYFSGIAAYEKEFEVPGVLLSPGTRLYLDLGRVRLVADVRLNGRHLGILWTDPFRLDVTEAVRPGANRLVVEVANDWSNRLVGDARSPSGPHYCRTNIARALTQKSPWKDHPLQESGLLGPVRLIPARLQNFETNP